jgi:hypothetical protein
MNDCADEQVSFGTTRRKHENSKNFVVGTHTTWSPRRRDLLSPVQTMTAPLLSPRCAGGSGVLHITQPQEGGSPRLSDTGYTVSGGSIRRGHPRFECIPPRNLISILPDRSVADSPVPFATARRCSSRYFPSVSCRSPRTGTDLGLLLRMVLMPSFGISPG